MKQRYRYRTIDKVNGIMSTTEWIEFSTQVTTPMFNGDGYCLDVSCVQVIPSKEGIEIIIYQGGKTLRIVELEEDDEQ